MLSQNLVRSYGVVKNEDEVTKYQDNPCVEKKEKLSRAFCIMNRWFLQCWVKISSKFWREIITYQPYDRRGTAKCLSYCITLERSYQLLSLYALHRWILFVYKYGHWLKHAKICQFYVIWSFVLHIAIKYRCISL